MVLKYTLFFTLLIGAAFAEYEFDVFEEQKECTKPGRMCSNCTMVSYCILMPDGFISEDLYACENGKTCLESIGDCSNVTNPKCDSNIEGFNFTCHQIGMFPDPFDCTKYHMCMEEKPITGTHLQLQEPISIPLDRASKVNPVPNSYKCAVGFSYDPLSTQCRNKLVNGTCANFVPPCTSVGQTGTLTTNTSIYYICIRNPVSKINFPHLFSCPNVQVYNGLQCVDQTSPPAVGPDFKCLAKGLYDDPTTCKKYVECPDKNANPIRRDCPTGYRFNYHEKKCVTMTCP